MLSIEEQLSRRVVGVVRKPEDLEEFDVCISTWQFLDSKKRGRELLEKYKDSFGLVFVDEVHKSASNCYSRVVHELNAKYRLGCSGTTKRKDKLHCVVEAIIGPVVVKGETKKVPAKVEIIKTNCRISKYMNWTNMETHLTKNERRNDLIVDRIIRDAQESGSWGIMGVTTRPAHAELLVAKLVDKGYTAEAFTGKTHKRQREPLLARVRSGETQIIIAIRSMVLGLNIPRLRYFHNLLPSANQPNYYQESSRVRTPMEGKDVAYIRDYVDNNGMCYGSLEIRKKVYRKEKIDFIDEVERQTSSSGFLSNKD
jgi:superfamily II DNA or RNA helicase